MATWRIEFSGDSYEEKEILSVYANAQSIYTAVCDVKNKIRSRVKYEDISEKEADFLDELRELLCFNFED